MAIDLTTTLAATMAALIGAASPEPPTQNIWSAHDTGGATWNASNVFLAGVANKSCIAFKQDPANTFAAHATVIGPNTLLCAAHVAPAVGATGYAYKEDGTVVPFTVASIDQIPGTDLCVITTTAAMTGVQVARMLPANWRSYISNTTTPVYGIFTTQDEKLFVGYCTGSNMSARGPLNFDFFSTPTDTYYAWFKPQRGGDSSSPWFFIIGGYLVLNEQALDVGYGQDDGYFTSQIQAIMNARSGDTITYIDLSGFIASSNPVTYPTNPPVTQPLLANLPIIELRADTNGATADYTYASALAAIKSDFTSPANFILYLIGGTPFTGNTTNTGQIVGGASGSSLTVLGATTNIATVGALLQADNAGQPIIRGGTDTYRISDVANSLQQLNLSGLQYGSSTNSGLLAISSLGSQSAITVGNCFFRAISTSTLLNVVVSANAACAITNTGFLVNNSISATQVMLQTSGTGGSNMILSHLSCHVSGAPLGFMRVDLNANQIRTLTLTNMDTTSTNSSFGSFGTITLASGAASLVLNGSGIRTGIWNATSVAAAGVTIIDNVTDVVQGLTSAALFSNTTLGLNILTNANTLVAATTTPVAMDINGANRPQFLLNGSVRVYAGIVNANIAIGGLIASVVQTTATVSFTAFTGADHYTLSLNGVDQGTFVSGGTMTISRNRVNTWTVSALDAGNAILADASASLFPNRSTGSPLILGVI